MIKYNMTKQKYHYMYRTTCTQTGRFYVGMHSTDNLKDGYLGSGKLLGYSRKKYGDENHKLEILEFLQTREELKEREKEIVNENLLANPLCMNLKFGGDGGWMKGVGVNIQEQQIDATARANSAAETRRKRERDPEYRAAFRKALSDGHLGTKSFLDKTHSEETKAQMRASHVGKHFGIKNSQYGTCWVTDGIKPVKIKKDQLNEYLNSGYSRGRVFLVS